MESGGEGFEGPGLKRNHNFPTIPQLIYKFIILVLPGRR